MKRSRKFGTASQGLKTDKGARSLGNRARSKLASIQEVGAYSFVLDHLTRDLIKEDPLRSGGVLSFRQPFVVASVAWGVESSSVVECCVDARRRVSTVG